MMLWIILGLLFLIIMCLNCFTLEEKYSHKNHIHGHEGYNKIQRFRTVHQDIIKKIYKLLYILDKVFNEHNIEYWIQAGTFLGAIRHKGIIPWDDDGDVTIWEKDEQRLQNIIPILKKYNITLMETWFGYKIFFDDSQPIVGFNWKYPAIDIFTMKEDSNGNIIYKYKAAQNSRFGHCTFDKNMMYPLQKYKFGSFELTGVNQIHTNTYLNKCYGRDWLDYAYEQYDHENEKNINKIKLKLTCDERQPAEPIDLYNLHDFYIK